MFSSSVNSNFPRCRKPEERHGSASGRKNIASIVLSTTIENEWEKLREVKLKLDRDLCPIPGQCRNGAFCIMSNVLLFKNILEAEA